MNAANQPLPIPTTLGLKKSFGYGDRLGLATAGHLKADLKSDFAPIFAQQSIREMDRTHRSPGEVMLAAQTALARFGYPNPWGADADHLKTEADVKKTAAAGFTFFTIDPSAFVANNADQMASSDLQTEAARLIPDGVFSDPGWTNNYLGKKFEIANQLTLTFSQEQLWRAAVKYARAIHHCQRMAGWIRASCAGRDYEIEVSVDETDAPTSPEEHLFFGLELRRRGVNVVSLAPRFIGDFEKGIDFKGNIAAFEQSLQKHVAVARHCGPYKISIHSGSDKFSIYPVCGRVCGDLLHVKTAGTSYLEALRAVCRKDPQLFREIIEYSRSRFDQDRASYHISTTSAAVAALPRQNDSNTERVFLNEIPGRQLLHVTFGSVLTQGHRLNGQTFREAILSLLERNLNLYTELLDIHFTKHLSLLRAG
jgi:hypothetical protein